MDIIMKMKRFKDITIHCGCDSVALQEMVNIENACVIPEFKFDEEIEKMYEPDDKMAHILVTIEGLPQAILLLWVNEGNIEVINIVPYCTSVFRLGVDDYNTIVDTFKSKIILPVINNKYDISETSGEYTLQEVIPQSYQSLIHWSNNPGAPLSPFSHQLDLEMWFEFLCQLIRNGESLSTGQLEQWLRVEKGWPEEVVEETILKFEEEIDLLDYYVNRSH